MNTFFESNFPNIAPMQQSFNVNIDGSVYHCLTQTTKKTIKIRKKKKKTYQKIATESIPWTKDEDDLLDISLTRFDHRWKDIRNNWMDIAEEHNLKVHPRSPSMLRNRLYRRQEHSQPSKDKKRNVCSKCGELRRGHVCIGFPC